VAQFNIFIIRAVFGAVFAVVLTRMFYGKIEIVYVAGLSVFLVGMAYVDVLCDRIDWILKIFFIPFF